MVKQYEVRLSRARTNSFVTLKTFAVDAVWAKILSEHHLGDEWIAYDVLDPKEENV